MIGFVVVAEMDPESCGYASVLVFIGCAVCHREIYKRRRAVAMSHGIMTLQVRQGSALYVLLTCEVPA